MPPPFIGAARRLAPRLRAVLGIERGEVRPVATAAVLFFCILSAFTVLRPVRDALGLDLGLEGLRSLFFATALVSLLINPVFGWLVSRLGRAALVLAAFAFLIVSLIGFWLFFTLMPSQAAPIASQVFYVWHGSFSLFATMLFWALVSDRFDAEQGLRLFGPISVGGTLGAMVGPWLTSFLAQELGAPQLLLLAAAFLALALPAALGLASPSSPSARNAPASPHSTAPLDGAPVGGSAWAGAGALFRSPYLGGVAAYVLMTALLGALIYFTRLEMVSEAAAGLDARASMLGGIDLWTQACVLVVQLTLTGRLVMRLGLGATLAILPLTTALGFLGLAVFGSIAALIFLEASNSAVQRGVARPAREALFTVIGRQDKYKTRAFIDTFVFSSGAGGGAEMEGFLGRLGLGASLAAGIVFPLCLGWIAISLWLGHAYRRQAFEPAQ